MTGPDGTAIIIPPSALTQGAVVSVTALTQQDLPVKDPSGVAFIGGLALQMEGGAFKPGVLPQFVVPGLSLADGMTVVVSRVETMNGKSELKAMAVGSVSGGRIIVDRCLAGAETCIYNGRYALYAPERQPGFLSGTVVKSGSPSAGAFVLVDNLPFRALTEGTGGFEMVSLEGAYILRAYETSTGQRAADAGSIASGEVKQVVLTLSPYNPQVTAVLPADKATAVDLKTQIKVTFSDPIDPLTLEGGAFTIIQTPPLISDPDIIVQGHMSVTGQNSATVFVPDADLKANTAYRVRLTSAVKDAFGNSLVPFESVFTTGNVLGSEALPPGALKASMPDAEGYVTVRGGTGLTYGGAAVLVINRTKNIVVTVIADEDGSFMAKVKADLGDEIVVEVKDLLGNTTTLSTGLMQNDDGTAAVGAKGGTINGPGDITAVIPQGAFDNTIAVQVTTLPEDTIKDVKIHPELKTAGVFKIDMGGATSKEELKVSVPAPAWITPEHQVLLMKVVNVRGYDELTLACPAILKDGQLVSTSPPFDGVTDGGNYTFVSWVDASKGTAYVMMNTWMTQDIGYTIGDYDFVFSVPIERQKPVVITIPVNKLYDVVISDSSGNPIKTIPVQGPPARGQFAEEIIRVTDDTIAPTVFTSSIPDGSTGVLLTDNIVIEMSELLDPATVDSKNNPDAIIVTDSQGNRIQGTFYLAGDQKTLVFVPKYGYKYGETYAVTINGVKDLGGNAVEGYASKFTTFPTEDFGTISAPAAMAIDKYKHYVVVKGVDLAKGDLVHNSTIWIYDVSDPQAPVLVGSTSLANYIQDIKVLPDATITDRKGNTITGDFLVAVGGRYINYAYLDLFNITDPANPVFYESILLAWNTARLGPPPANVPADSGEAWEVALIGTNAYVATRGVGLQAVNLLEVVPPDDAMAQANAIGGTIAEPSYSSVSKVKNNLLAVKNGALSIISPQLQVIGEVQGLNYPASVTGVEAFPIDMDDDGNLGEYEDNDGDATTSQQENFDLAFVSTADGLVIIDVTDPANPKQMASIPGVRGGKVVVNKAKRLAYVSVGNDLYAISLTNPSGVGLIDNGKDGRDDRIVAIKPGYGFMDAVIEMDDLGRELLYLANYTDGQMRVENLGEERVISFVSCTECSFDTVKENLVYANSTVSSSRKVEIKTLSNGIRNPAEYRVRYGFKKDKIPIGSFDLSLADIDVTNKTMNNYKAGSQSGQDHIRVQHERVIGNYAVDKPAETVIYNYSLYDFNKIIEDTDYTSTPNHLNSQEQIESWLASWASVLAGRGVGEISAVTTRLLVDGGDARNGELPESGTIVIGKEEISYSGKQLVDNYKPALVVTQRNVNGAGASAHNVGNANERVFMKTLITGYGADGLTLLVNSTNGAAETGGELRVGSLRVLYESKTIDSFKLACTNCLSLIQGKSETAAFFEVGRAGTLVSRIIDYDTKRDPSRPISAAVILTHLQKEYGLVKARRANDAQLNHAMGCGVISDLESQLLCGTNTVRNKYYMISPNYNGEITSDKGRDNERIYYTEPDGSVNGPSLTQAQRDAQRLLVIKAPLKGTQHAVKLKIMNKATRALYNYTPHVSYWNISVGGASGGNSGFARAWEELGFR